ncbi:MAG: ribbon-helix-helix domain-containing protein [Candidatus Shapirobacteria bacterium]
MNTTINISLPSQLKAQADELVKHGFYASFSDLVRTALRREIERHKDEIALMRK